MMEILRRECWGPFLLFVTLFGPIMSGILSAVAVPFALFKPPVGWAFILLIVVDYVVPLKRTPWAWYHDYWIKRLKQSYYEYFPAIDLRADPELKISKDRRYLLCAPPMASLASTSFSS